MAAAGEAAAAVAREDWMTTAMPRAKAEAPEVDQAAEATPEQPKKVITIAFALTVTLE